ncbi:MAG TPA: hypothetical protein VN739_03015 [Nitrososphaerales archaeon]|nr:hypothetical protein [Nitrososphaerales archaeon]
MNRQVPVTSQINCSRCGAPFLVQPRQTPITCSYCGLTTSESGKIEVGKLSTISVSDYVRRLVPRELPKSLDHGDNAIKLRTVLIFGREESGKSNTAQIIVDELKKTYGSKNVGSQWFQAENFRTVLESNWSKKPVQILVCEDITNVKFTDDEAKDFFRMRHIMAERTGKREGLCVCIFTLHRFHDIPKSFRSDYDSLIVLSLPMNDWDLNFIANKITQNGVKILEQAEADEAHGQAIVSVRRHLLAVTRFPRHTRQKNTISNLLRRLFRATASLLAKRSGFT